MGHININGLESKNSLLEAQCNSRYYDIIAITETKLMPADTDNSVALDGFNFYRLDRTDVGGGGVGVYVRNNSNVEIITHSDPEYDNTPEYLILEICTPSHKLLFAVVYRHPHAAYPTEFFTELVDILPSYNQVIITGDFNINLCTDSSDSRHLLTQLQSCSLFLVPSEPMHHMMYRDRMSHTWLDLFFLHSESALKCYRKSEAPFAAGHDFTEIEFNLRRPPKITKHFWARDLIRIDNVALNETIKTNLEQLFRRSASLNAP